MPMPFFRLSIEAVGIAFATNFVPSPNAAVCPAFGKFEDDTWTVL